MLRAIVTATLILGATSAAPAATIESTVTGGAWSSGSTWVGGVAPDGDDDVILMGPVTVAGSKAAGSLVVEPTGALLTGAGGPGTLHVAGDVTCRGSMSEGGYWLDLEVGGDLTLAGSCTNREIRFVGDVDHHLSTSPLYTVGTDLTVAAGSTGDILVDMTLTTAGNIDTRDAWMVLAPGSDLILAQSLLSGGLRANGNQVIFQSWSYLGDLVADQAVLVGIASITHQVSFTGGLTVEGTFQNERSFGSAHVPIAGTLVNRGHIKNDQYGLTIALAGDLENDGLITCSYIAMDDAETRAIRMGPDGVMSAPLLFPEFGAAEVVMETDAAFTEGVSLGLDGRMTLAPDTRLILTGRGSVTGGTLLADGNVIDMMGTGYLDLTEVDHAVLEGEVQVQDQSRFTGGLRVEGTLRNWEFADADVVVEGTLRNEGALTNNVRTLTVRIRGDLENLGVCANERLIVDGEVDQVLGVGAGITIPEVVIASNLTGTSFQWYRDGLALDGETGPDLVFTAVGEAEYGTYVCVADGAATSRSIVIEEGEVVVGVAATPSRPVAVLGPATPNPSRSRVALAFELARPGVIDVSVYDAGGRRVASLARGAHASGRHRVTWSDAAAPGIYFVRLRGDGIDLSRKLTRLD